MDETKHTEPIVRKTNSSVGVTGSVYRRDRQTSKLLCLSTRLIRHRVITLVKGQRHHSLRDTRIWPLNKIWKDFLDGNLGRLVISQSDFGRGTTVLGSWTQGNCWNSAIKTHLGKPQRGGNEPITGTILPPWIPSECGRLSSSALFVTPCCDSKTRGHFRLERWEIIGGFISKRRGTGNQDPTLDR